MRVLAFLMSLTLSSFVFSNEIAKGWSQYAHTFLDKPLNSTLQVMKDEGFLMVDVGGNYVGYALRGDRTSTEERQQPLSVLNRLPFTVDFQSCDQPTEGFMVGTVNRITVRLMEDETPGLALELRDLVMLTDELGYQKTNFGNSHGKEDQTFLLWSMPPADANTEPSQFAEIQINESPHQLVWTAYKNCP